LGALLKTKEVELQKLGIDLKAVEEKQQKDKKYGYDAKEIL
jgi:hypothetical protein